VIIKGPPRAPLPLAAHAGTSFVFSHKRCVHLFKARPVVCGTVVQRMAASVLRATTFKRPSFSPVPALSSALETKKKEEAAQLYHDLQKAVVGLEVSRVQQHQRARVRVHPAFVLCDLLQTRGCCTCNLYAPDANIRHLTKDPAISQLKLVLESCMLFLLLVPESSIQVPGVPLEVEIQN
jgi:hypothetical protein